MNSTIPASLTECIMEIIIGYIMFYLSIIICCFISELKIFFFNNKEIIYNLVILCIVNACFTLFGFQLLFKNNKDYIGNISIIISIIDAIGILIIYSQFSFILQIKFGKHPNITQFKRKCIFNQLIAYFTIFISFAIYIIILFYIYHPNGKHYVISLYILSFIIISYDIYNCIYLKYGYLTFEWSVLSNFIKWAVIVFIFSVTYLSSSIFNGIYVVTIILFIIGSCCWFIACYSCYVALGGCIGYVSIVLIL